MKLLHKESKRKKETRSLPMGRKIKNALTLYSALVLVPHRHHPECGVPAGFRPGPHHALQLGVHRHAQPGGL